MKYTENNVVRIPTPNVIENPLIGPDVFVRPSRKNEFLDYEFTANNEDEFTGFQIKIVMSGTNEADPPRFQDLRVIALA